MTIVKVQRPITSTDPLGPWLIYDQHRARECMIYGKDMPEEVKKQMHTSFKEFFEAEWDQEALVWKVSGRRLRMRNW